MSMLIMVHFFILIRLLIRQEVLKWERLLLLKHLKILFPFLYAFPNNDQRAGSLVLQ